MEHDRSISESEETQCTNDELAAIEAGRKRWEAALENPEAQAFINRAMQRVKELDDRGLIRRG